MVIGSRDFTWLTKLNQYIHIAKVIEEVVLKEREGVEERKRKLCNLSTKIGEDVDQQCGRPYWHHHCDELGITRWLAMRKMRGGKYLFSSSDEDS